MTGSPRNTDDGCHHRARHQKEPSWHSYQNEVNKPHGHVHARDLRTDGRAQLYRQAARRSRSPAIDQLLLSYFTRLMVLKQFSNFS